MNTVVLDLPDNSFVTQFEISNGHYITFEEYLKMDIEGARLEWVDGKVEAFVVNNLPHQEIIGFLLAVMRLFIETHNLGKVIPPGYAMKINEKRGREPDLVFVRRKNFGKLSHNYLDGAADIAVEVVSPESVSRDRETKFAEYEAAGVGEYWLIDPERREAVFYLLDENSCYQPADTSTGVFRSGVLPNFFIRLDWLWQENPPTLTALRELKLL